MSGQRTLTIIARDPSVRVRGRILRAHVDIPADTVGPGPRSSRAEVIDYDASTRTLYQPDLNPNEDVFAGASDRALLSHPHFHAQNTFAIVTRMLARFEQALGRQVDWGFPSHQIKIAPHAFRDANAFYSKQNESLLFGYFPALRGRRMIYSCLSHDVVAHETAHALLDGIRGRLVEAAGPDQAALHEGFADLVALLSLFSLRPVVDAALAQRRSKGGWKLTDPSLLRVARQVGQEIHGRQALRKPVELPPSRRLLRRREFQDPHRRGEILVAAILRAFLDQWSKVSSGQTARARVIDEGANLADHVLTAVVRALDYCPPVNITFSDFLSAILTADFEHNGCRSRPLRDALRRSFHRFGVSPVQSARSPEPGVWPPPAIPLQAAVPADALHRNKHEIFQFLWSNREALGWNDEAYVTVESVNPAKRVDERGFHVQEIVADYVKTLRIRAGELAWLTPAVIKPAGMPDSQMVTLTGGAALVFDRQSRLKYDIRSSLKDAAKQSARLQYLWDTGYFESRDGEERER